MGAVAEASGTQDKTAAGKRVYVDGDSLGVGTARYIPTYLPGWKVKQTLAISRRVVDGQRAIAELARKGTLAPIVVMQLGTNDDPGGISHFGRAVKRTVKAAGNDRCVVWTNIVRPPLQGRSYTGLNETLKQLARKRKNLRIVDWAGLVEANRHWLESDGVHVRVDGYKARARAIGREAKRCRQYLARR